MTTESQEAIDTAQEQEISIADFRAMTKPETLEKFEAERREEILAAPYSLKEKFDNKWRSVFGRPYFQPITTSPRQVVPGYGQTNARTDPKSLGYKGFWEVLFSPKAKPDDPNDVTLSVNGQCLQIKRDEPVILPGPFLECADHTLYPSYSQLPNQERKITAWIRHFPYTVLRPATNEEYLAQKTHGDKVAQAAREAAQRAT